MRPTPDNLHGVAQPRHRDRSSHANSFTGGLTSLVVAPAPDPPGSPDQDAGMVVAGHDLLDAAHARHQ